ncbi:hypothetical protein KSP39_PZI014809 [Platanthera zijinensis]|uniref:Uncharacterized protein n=1 Tax=Platanthera zijinensis TaxID=2320716 RepID=A0AAP0B9G3_9ASPA
MHIALGAINTTAPSHSFPLKMQTFLLGGINYLRRFRICLARGLELFVWGKCCRTADNQMAGGGVCSVCTRRVMENGEKRRDFNRSLPPPVPKALLLLPPPEHNAKLNQALLVSL